MIKTNKIPWNIAYRNLYENLLDFHEKYKDNSGGALYDLCVKTKKFVDINQWVEKAKNTEGVASIDPIQVFASISSRMDVDARRERINTWNKILNPSNTDYDNIEFKGCPSPPIIAMISIRTVEQQNEIWEVFTKIKKESVSVLNANLLKKIKSWYGVDIRSFTMFLFWIDSDNFLPLDKNTVTLLLDQKRIDHTPNNFKDYIPLITKKNTALYRNIALISYNKQEREKLNKEEKDEVNDYLEREKLISADFKIIAIRPLEGFNVEYLKTLKENELYSFYKAYTIENNKIQYDRTFDTRMYDLPDVSLKVNVSAIVGMNGTGKSTLLEILFLAINNMTRLINESKFRKLVLVEKINIELYIKTTSILKLTLNDKILTIIEFLEEPDGNYVENNTPVQYDKNYLKNLFYTIAANYSLYSLNTNHLGDWIYELFHKNDAYQTPLVIEPYRSEGKIDVNTQEQLAKSRLLVNLLELEHHEEKNGFRQLTKFFKADQIVLTLNKKKFEHIYEDEHSNYIIEFKDILKAEKILKTFLEPYNLTTDIDTMYGDKTSLEGYALRYILKKLVNITLNYPHYNYFKKRKKQFKSLPNYFKKLRKDNSHITYKLRQAINFLRFNHIKKLEMDSPYLEILSADINTVKQEQFLKGEELETIELIPPPFYNVDILLRDKVENKKIKFNTLSSGEIQKIYSASSILYQLRNIDSAANGSKKLTTYRFVNIALDEVELYFHPEMQRTYISHLLNVLNKVELNNINCLNFCFVTHSPFILSDIPSHNILFLDKIDEKSIPKDLQTRTFGANIHRLLINGFFMEQTLGDYALNKIKGILDFYNKVIIAPSNLSTELIEEYENSKQEFDFILNNVGEDYIRGILKNHLDYIKTRMEIESANNIK